MTSNQLASEAWTGAVATMSRIESVLAQPAGDLNALQDLLHQAERARDALDASAHDAGMEDAMAETRAILLISWVALLRKADESSPIIKTVVAPKCGAFEVVQPPPSRRKELVSASVVLSLAAGAVWILGQL